MMRGSYSAMSSPVAPNLISAREARLESRLRTRRGQRLGLGDRRPAGEALADVDRRPALDEALAGKERDLLGRPEGDDRVRVEAGKRGAGDLAVGRAEDRELARRREV